MHEIRVGHQAVNSSNGSVCVVYRPDTRSKKIVRSAVARMQRDRRYACMKSNVVVVVSLRWQVRASPRGATRTPRRIRCSSSQQRRDERGDAEDDEGAHVDDAVERDGVVMRCGCVGENGWMDVWK